MILHQIVQWIVKLSFLWNIMRIFIWMGFCFDLYTLWSLFVFVLMQSLKTSPAKLIIIITFSMCHRVVFFCKPKLLNRQSITHKPQLPKHCISSDPWSTPQGRLTGVKLGQEIHRDYEFQSLHFVYHDRLLTISHTVCWKKYLGAMRRLRYNGVCVI